MKIIVFGATGGVGRHVVNQALQAGYEVTAFVRDLTKLQIENDHLHVVRGDATNAEEVSAAIAGHDAVVSCLGSNKMVAKSTQLEEMTQHIVAGMEAHHVKRIVYTASAGINNELPGVGGKMVMKMLQNVLTDHRHAVDLIQAHKDLQYTIVRPLGLTNDDYTGEYREAKEGVPENARNIPRADVAHFILKALGDDTYIGESVGIAQ
ncbi:MAG: NAD(P)-dependent oxidoreductase [Kurthia gibsonii]|uniref:NAD(P)-binding oxidoreductase n=1 Tax=Kurthia gibsonii TaxID=33946 RepID=A0ABU9LR04_9BACL|nr:MULTISPECIES: NAD(P)-binding oxidoreductase [Kurthia]AMA63982.1 3-beta hydroxysteroid dehydrogenase/isomerase family protein [Kurthia sp. 11kri321]MEB6113819.1 SDR family oxidoreductase [Kurthia gibsonii]MEB7773152.1 SDR family oxidoreductase [Kurthia gibsonii]